MSKNWIYTYGERVGKSHLPKKIPCQDKALCAYKNDVYVAVVSDGCGSSEISQHGSLVTTQAICDLFTERFDELYNEEILTTRKTIVNGIVGELQNFIATNEKIFEDYKIKSKEKYESFTARRSEEEWQLDCLNATVLFVAQKHDQFILGQIGDGIIGAVIDNKIKIVMEEKKDGEVNGTIYPANIYNLAKEDDRWFATSQFQLKKPRNANLQGFILMSDGVDGLIDQRIAFQKKFAAGVGKLIKNTIKAESLDERQKSLNDELLPRLVEFSKARDDCSLALLIQDDCEVDDDGYVVTHYERPVIKDEEEDEEFDEHFRIDDLELDTEKTPAEIREEKEKEKSYEKDNLELLETIKTKIDEKEAVAFYKKATVFFQYQSNLRVTELLNCYLNMLKNLDNENIYTFERNEKEYKNLTIIYQFDEKVERMMGNKITRR